MHQVLLVLQILISIGLVGAILLQPRGSGLGKVFGATNVSFSRRGLDRLIYRLTFVLAFLFVLVAFISLLF